MLMEAFESVVPYLTNIDIVRKFVEENKNKSEIEIMRILEEKTEKSEGTLRTDFKILLNEFSKKLNMEM
ncbi:MAG: hypothetical protein GXO25_01540 [Euryarchaeota archaeon]|nr:hypothetical protein [Euryarchaeota archaeon]